LNLTFVVLSYVYIIARNRGNVNTFLKIFLWYFMAKRPGKIPKISISMANGKAAHF
jgi:hypothetical protein